METTEVVTAGRSQWRARFAGEARTLLLAWQYFVRIPLPAALSRRVEFTQDGLERAIRYFSLAGIFVGCLAGVVFWGGYALLHNQGLAILLSMAATILATGALHEDGLGDFFDGFVGGWQSKARILEIMKDSRLGTFGVLALVMTLLIKWQTLTALPAKWVPAALIAGHAFSRFASGAFIFTHQYARANDNDAGRAKPMIKHMSQTDFIILTVIGMVPLVLVHDLLVLLGIPLLWGLRAGLGYWFSRKIGGYTGDCIGAAQQLIEAAFYIIVLVAWRF